MAQDVMVNSWALFQLNLVVGSSNSRDFVDHWTLYGHLLGLAELPVLRCFGITSDGLNAMQVASVASNRLWSRLRTRDHGAIS